MAVADDYQDEMEALSPEEIDAVLGGGTPRDPRAARAAALVTDLRRALREDPAPEVASAHVDAMVAAAGARPGGRSAMLASTKRRIGGVGLAAALMLGGSLAAAVTLPPQADDRVRQAVERGSSVSADGSVSGEASAHGKAVQAVAQDPGVEGCRKGQAVAEVASSKAEGPPDEVDRPDPCERGQHGEPGSEGGSRGAEASAFGRAKATQAEEDGEAFGQETAAQAQSGGADFGQQTATEASAGAGGPEVEGGGGAEAGTTIGNDASGGVSGSAGPPPGTPGGPPGS
jgi:hypothetical protein